MKKSISKIMIAATLFLSFTACQAKIKNAKTETVKVYGNCEMCEKVIEKAGNLKNISNVDWNKDTKMATLTYDATKTNQNEILKRIALAGYDSDAFLAPTDVYNNLANCCQYDRLAKTPTTATVITESHIKKTNTEMKESNQLKAVFDSYFAVKDALVKTDGSLASTKSSELLTAINAVKMDKLEMDVHMVWMKVMADLKKESTNIGATKDIAKQRDYFMGLTKSMYPLLKASKTETPTYYQYCPMANNGKGANWLSKDSAVKNPYYGSKMMSCGKTIETIK